MSKKLTVVITTYDALPCRCEIFTINGVDGDADDFGSVWDIDPEIAEPYGCGDMQFCPNEKSKRGILKKYSITGKQYKEVCSMLEDKLAVGQCGWCI